MSGNFNKIVSPSGKANAIDELTNNNNSTPPPVPPRPSLQQPPYQSFIGQNRRLPCYYAQNGEYSLNNVDFTTTQNVTNVQQPQNSAMTSTNYAHQYVRNFPAMADTYYGDLYKILENKSSNTFKSINSVIRTLNSIVNVLETTMNAFYTTFQAIVNVMDHFVSLKRVLSQMVTSLAVVKFIRWILQQFLPFSSGNRVSELTIEHTWDTIERSIFHSNDKYPPQISIPKVTSLSAITSFALLIGGPVLIYKFLRKIVANMEENRRWATGESDHYSATAIFDFSASNSNEISMSADQTLRVAPKELQPPVIGWLLASVDGQEIGLVPANYVKIHAKVSGQKCPT